MKRRQTVKELLIAEAGGRCVVCGYDRHPAALHFHHIDPSTKEFGLSTRGVARSLEQARLEARKCVPLCATCHAEVEAGVTPLRSAASTPGRKFGLTGWEGVVSSAVNLVGDAEERRLRDRAER